MAKPDIFFFRSCTSTQEMARDFVSRSHRPPFVIITGSQTRGLGRRKTSWDSPTGNIYLSLVVDLTKISVEQIPKLSIAVSTLICEWIFSLFGFTPTLKWPNDLYFRGAKLSGVLIDTSMDGPRHGSVIIGVGLNCVPTQVTDKKVAAISLFEILHKKKSIKKTRAIAQSLALHLYEELNELNDQSLERIIVDRAEKFLPVKGTPILKEDERHGVSDEYFFLRLSKSGSILCQSASDSIVDLGIYINDSLKWPTLNKNLSSIIIADIGNSQTKVYKKRLGEWEKVSELPINQTVFCVSVNDAEKMKCAQQLQSNNSRLVVIGKRAIRSQFPNYDFSRLGIDRLCLIEHYLSLCRSHKKQKGSVIVSFGTAITIDIVRSDGMHCAGWISAGLQTMLNALHERTALLPQVTFSERALEESLHITTTEDAMLQGCSHAAIGLVKEALTIARKKYKLSILDLYFAGGDAERMRTFFPKARLNLTVPEGALRLLSGG